MTPKLGKDVERAVLQHHGCIYIDGEKSTYIIMSADVFRETMDIGTDESLEESLKAIEEGLAGVEAGRTRPMDAFFKEFDARHDIHC